MLARRSLGLWPIEGDNENTWWEGVGDFLRDTLAIRMDDVGQDDIESVTRMSGPACWERKKKFWLLFMIRGRET